MNYDSIGSVLQPRESSSNIGTVAECGRGCEQALCGTVVQMALSLTSICAPLLHWSFFEASFSRVVLRPQESCRGRLHVDRLCDSRETKLQHTSA